MDDQLLDQKLQEALKLNEAGKSYPEIRDHFDGHRRTDDYALGFARGR